MVIRIRYAAWQVRRPGQKWTAGREQAIRIASSEKKRPALPEIISGSAGLASYRWDNPIPTEHSDNRPASPLSPRMGDTP